MFFDSYYVIPVLPKNNIGPRGQGIPPRKKQEITSRITKNKICIKAEARRSSKETFNE